ncbi:hypothetical protein EDB80DRAFT_889490 [Ilyonectria destructans]|nr:hypothetical protein EDB80DRAFT_889490 [Ilyonectria destructans]
MPRSVKATFLEIPVFEGLDFFHGRDVFEQCAHALGTSAFNLWKQREHVFPPMSTLIYRTYRAFFVKGLDPGDLAPRVYLPIVASELLAMLVALLHNLRHLRVMENGVQSPWGFDISMATISSLGLTGLPLKALEIDRSLQTLFEIVPDHDTLVTRYPSGFSWPKLRCLKTLRMGEGMIHWVAIKHVLSACTNHLSFFYYTGSGTDEIDTVDLLDKESPGDTGIMRCMAHFKVFAKLETLFLTTRSFYNMNSASLDDQSLVSLLPPSITSLTLVDHEPTPPERLQEGLLGLANAKISLFKQLKQIRCDSKEACDDHVRDTFERVGVDFSYQEFSRTSWSHAREPLPIGRIWDFPPSAAHLQV